MYGKGAFYDLTTTGFQATLANNVPVGETCIVASLDAMGDVTFDWYRFMRETVKADNYGCALPRFFRQALQDRDAFTQRRNTRRNLFAILQHQWQV